LENLSFDRLNQKEIKRNKQLRKKKYTPSGLVSADKEKKTDE
jgi:hypothetical protein